MKTYAVPIRVRRVKLGGSGLTSAFCALVGALSFLIGFLFAAIIFWPLAFIAFLGAVLTDSKHGHIHYCGECGNEVAPTSRLCPYCQSRLLPATTRRPSSLLTQLAYALLILAAIGALLLYLHHHHNLKLPWP